MLNQAQITEIRHFLNRLQGREVRVEISSRLNPAMRLSFALTVQANAEAYSFVSSDGDITVFLDPMETEAYSSDATSISLMYGDNLISIRHARQR